MGTEYFFLYLIYGFTFINMGIFSIREKDIEVSNIPLIKSLKYLGYFGISHGISEWITMIIILNLYNDLHIYLFIVKQILKAISFMYLMIFGISLIPMKDKYKNIDKKIPIIIFTLWLSLFVFFIRRYGLDYHILNPRYNTISLRYFMAFPGGLVSSIALYLHSKLIEQRKLNKIAKRYKSLSYIFLIYSILDGLIVTEMNFFPANIINNKVFLERFGFPVQILKVLVGIIIIFLLMKVIDTFGWQQREKLNRLQKQRVSYEERRKLGLEIHDSIIQSLYAAGLKVEFLIKSNLEERMIKILQEIKMDLNNTIDNTREFISSTSLDLIELEDLKDNIQQLIKRTSESKNIKIDLKYEISSLNLGQLSPKKSTQIYYIIQEAVTNIIKHSKATNAEIFIEGKYDFLYIKVIDNGVGISEDNLKLKDQFGISSMKERTDRVGGLFNMENISQGTKIEVIVPWEVSTYEED